MDPRFRAPPGHGGQEILKKFYSLIRRGGAASGAAAFIVMSCQMRSSISIVSEFYDFPKNCFKEPEHELNLFHLTKAAY
jgi:hypothetical protein